MATKNIKKHENVGWNPNLPLLTLPKVIRNRFIEEAKFLYRDLDENKQEVALIPAPSPYEDRNKIRVAISYPPEWYSQLYETLGRNRKRTLEALSRIIESKDKEFKKHNYKLDTILKNFIFYRLTEGYKHMGREVPPAKKIKEYFSVE